ncbi:conserved Plasmodium protein, unknown function [Plasmodium relictum]|uniref:Uncharacterized protein n=1 Tax=Plasmodium relictum TaxID=85471 RepID=A0A1J1H8F7_PLARL|nr:conserved Plasmodium protein, unknown function [Plasmodium relictum]CRH01256.1 conserved Plasmodium protein, unknown function [Plasmodium relictum]
MNFKLKKKIKKKKKNEANKEEFYESETRTFNREISYDTRRKNFSLPKITRNGVLTYDEENNKVEEKKSRKKEKEKLKLRKLLDNIKKRKVKKKPFEEEIFNVSNKIKNFQDIRNIIATTANNIIADQNLNIKKFDLLFYIFKESLKGKRELDRENKYNDYNFKIKHKYFENINILSCISICTILKCITPSYKIFNTADVDNDATENNSNLNNKKKKSESKNFSKIIQSVNKLEQMIVKYFRDFCNILKENICDNTTVYVNLLCEIVTVNLYLSKNEKLLEYLILYSNIYTYHSKKYNKGGNNKNSEILCMKCLNTLNEIIDNDHNLSFTLTLVDYFSKYIFKKEKSICPNLLKIFSNINITEKKIHAKLYSDQDKNDNEGKNNELQVKTNICGNLKIIEKNTEKILDQLFLIYLCVLREYKKYSIFFVKNVLYAISNYALYINKLIMDDVFEEIKAIAKENKTSPSLRMTSIHIFLKILNKVNDNIYIDCSWIASCLLHLLDSSIHYFHTGSSTFLLQNRNFIYNNFLDSDKYYLNDNENSKTDNLKNGKPIKYNSSRKDKLKEKYNFSSEMLYCIDLLLKTKNFTNNYNNFKSSNNHLLCRIIYHLFNISLHSDYVISFSILKIIQSIMMKFPLVKCIVEKEGIVISYMNDNLSIFFQNILFHSCLFKEISSLALDISLNDSNENYNAILKNYINRNNCYVKNKTINYNMNLSEKRIIDENKLMKCDFDDIFHKHRENFDEFNTIKKNNFKESVDKSFILSNDDYENISINNLSPYMLTAIDFIEIIFSPYNKFIKYFQKEQERNKNITGNNYKNKSINYKEDKQKGNQKEKKKNYNKIKKIIKKKKKKNNA